jgi:hypothetical protein
MKPLVESIEDFEKSCKFAVEAYFLRGHHFPSMRLVHIIDLKMARAHLCTSDYDHMWKKLKEQSVRALEARFLPRDVYDQKHYPSGVHLSPWTRRE